MLLEFENKIAGFIKTNRLFESADKVLLAVSGGADSTALMYTMRAMKAEGALSAEMLCAHINHQLRGTEADLDEDFVIAQAGNLNFPITTRRLDVRGFARKNKLSIVLRARSPQHFCAELTCQMGIRYLQLKNFSRLVRNLGLFAYPDRPNPDYFFTISDD
ncbi:tRNA(Ile)-lysidine synthase [subsurface metagenome]